MAYYSEKAASMARILAIVHIIVGFLLFCFGIADFGVKYFWTGYGCFGIWIGIWMVNAGSFGILGTRKDGSALRNTWAGVFMGFSITSAVFGGIIIICYGLSIAMNRARNYSYYNYYSQNKIYDVEMALSAIILILGIAPQQGPGGVPMAFPMQAGGSMFPTQTVTPWAQAGHPQLIQVAPAEAMVTGYQP